MDPGVQHPVFPGSHPSKYYPRSMCRNFSERATELALVTTASLRDALMLYCNYNTCLTNIVYVENWHAYLSLAVSEFLSPKEQAQET